MRLFFKYLKQKRRSVIACGVFALIFAVSFFLYRLPVEAVIYPVFLCAVIGLFLLGFDYLRVKRKHEALTKIKTITDAMTASAITSAISTAKSEAIAASDTKGAAAQALSDAKAYADAEDKKIEDTIGTVTQGKTVVKMIEDVGTTASTNLTNTLKNYSTTTQMNKAITDNAVNTVVSGSANGTIAVDGQDVAVKGLGSAAYTASSAYDASGSAATAKSEAIAAAKTETTTQVNGLANGAVKTNTDNITTITTNLGGLNGVTIPEACKSGRCALVMEAGEAKWETING